MTLEIHVALGRGPDTRWSTWLSDDQDIGRLTATYIFILVLPSYSKQMQHFENDILLLNHLSDTPIREPKADLIPRPRPTCPPGAEHQIRVRLVQAHLGLSAPASYIIENMELYSDADALIIVLDSRDEEAVRMVNSCLERSLKGRFKSVSRIEDREFVCPKLRREIPWLAVVNFDDRPLDEQRAHELVGILDPDGFGVDWCLCLISTGSCEGIEDAASLIRKKPDNPGLEWRDVSNRCMN